MSVESEAPFMNYDEAPKDYSCSGDGVFFWKEDKDGNKEKDWISYCPIVVIAKSRDETSNAWGTVVRWLDDDEFKHEVAIPKELFHAHGTEIAQRLVSGGLPLVPGKEKSLLIYLSRFKPKNRVIAASATGWLRESFVMPKSTLRQPKGETIVYQPQGFSNVAESIDENGSYKSWLDGMREASLVVRFIVCAALSAPVRFKADVEGGGFHFYDLTSRGKTTTGQAGASVWGNGVDPAIAGGRAAYIQRWNSTANALEAKAEVFNDLPMIIDEIGEGDSREFGSTIYRIISGSGRSRAGKEGNLRDSKTWRASIISFGELAVSDFIESGGGRIKGGQLVRMVDIDLSALPDLYKDSEEANAMKKLCAEHYGYAGRELILKVDDLAKGWKEFQHEKIGASSSTISERVRARFALVAHTGIIASRNGVIPWSEKQVIQSVADVYSAWKLNANVVSDIERGIEKLMDYMTANAGGFHIDEEVIPKPRLGWRRGDMYHFTPASFKEACAGVNPDKIKRELLNIGCLHRSDKTRLNSQIRVDGELTRVVSVKISLLKKAGTDGYTGYAVPTDSDACPVHESPETPATKGVYPVYPLVPGKNNNIENIPDDDSDDGVLIL